MIFYPGNEDSTELKIISALNDLATDPASKDWSTTKWTREVKCAVAQLGKSLGLFVYGHNCEPTDGGEWLYDLCWLKYSDASVAGKLVAAHLVMESEWSPKDADDDFQKLVLARSKYRVMVFAVETGTERADGFERLIGHAGANVDAEAGDRYLMCCWNNERRGFEFRVYTAARA